MNEVLKIKKSTEYLTIDGAKVPYLIEGEGIDCLVLTLKNQHQPTFSEELRKHFKLIFVDAINSISPQPVEPEKITMDSLVVDIEKIRKSLNLDKIAILGASGFGLIAFEYALKFPERTSHLIMIAPLPDFSIQTRKKVSKNFERNASDARKALIKSTEEALTEEKLRNLSPLDALKLLYIKRAPLYWYDPTYDCSWFWEGVDANMDYFNQYFYVILNEYRINQNLERLKTPVFLALGKYDYVAPYILWKKLLEKIPRLTCHLFNKSGHFPMLEEQSLFDEKLIEWLK